MLYRHLLYAVDRDVAFERDGDGRATCNVPHAIHCYGNGAYDWGTSSPACRELSLNLLNWWFPALEDPSGFRRINGASVSRRVWAAHQDFAVDFLLRVPQGGGVLRLRDAHWWLMERIVFPEGANNADQDAG